MAASHPVIPLSIVLSGVIIATGLYLGLRHPPAPTLVAAPPPTAPPPPAAPIVPAPAAPKPPPLTPEIVARATDNARQALEAMRPELIRRCWTPAVKRPAALQLRYKMSFSPEGKIVVLGISELSESAGVATCLRSIAMPLKIPAPGHSLETEVSFTLP